MEVLRRTDVGGNGRCNFFMQKDLIGSIKSSLLKLGIYQVAGGLIGAGLLLDFLWQHTDFLPNSSIILYAVMLLFFSYSLFCGFFCLNSKPLALKHSLINQYLQLITFSFFGYAYTYCAGLNFLIGLNFTNSIKFDFNFGLSKIYFGINTESKHTNFSINLVALFFIYWILSVRKKTQLLEEIAETDSLGKL